MKLLKLVGVLGLVALLVPLSGCIGDDEADPAPQVSGGREVQEGAPPSKFTFESAAGKPSGEVLRMHNTRERGALPVLKETADEWKFSWNVTGLQDLGAGEDGDAVGEAFYNIWLGKKNSDEEIIWEQVSQSQSVGKDGKISGTSTWKSIYGGYVGVLVSLETKADSQVEIPLLEVTAFEDNKKEEETHPLEDLGTFGAAFADAKVTTKDGKVNLTVTAFTLPDTRAAYDVFLRNERGTHYLGSLSFDVATGGHSIAVQPDPKLFTKYQFFISLEAAKEKKEEPGGFQVLKSNFKG